MCYVYFQEECFLCGWHAQRWQRRAFCRGRWSSDEALWSNIILLQSAIRKKKKNYCYYPVSLFPFLLSSSVNPFSSFPQSFPTSGAFLLSQYFASGGQSTGASTSASVLPMNIQGWFPLELTGLISLQSKELSRVFFSTTVQKHQFFGTQPSLWSNSHICTQLLKNHNFD